MEIIPDLVVQCIRTLIMVMTSNNVLKSLSCI